VAGKLPSTELMIEDNFKERIINSGHNLFINNRTKYLDRMKKLYYRGQPYDFEVSDLLGKRFFVLYDKNGEVVQYVKEDELDIRSRVSMILDEYYSVPQSTIQTNALS
jgi:hypothetical protein